MDDSIVINLPYYIRLSPETEINLARIVEQSLKQLTEFEVKVKVQAAAGKKDIESDEARLLWNVIETLRTAGPYHRHFEGRCLVCTALDALSEWENDPSRQGRAWKSFRPNRPRVTPEEIDRWPALGPETHEIRIRNCAVCGAPAAYRVITVTHLRRGSMPPTFNRSHGDFCHDHATAKRRQLLAESRAPKAEQRVEANAKGYVLTGASRIIPPEDAKLVDDINDT